VSLHGLTVSLVDGTTHLGSFGYIYIYIYINFLTYTKVQRILEGKLICRYLYQNSKLSWIIKME
jgi:hypothetical protein